MNNQRKVDRAETEEEKLQRKFANLPSSGRIGPTTSEQTVAQIGLDIQKLLAQRDLSPGAPTTAAELLEIQRLGRQLEELYHRETVPRRGNDEQMLVTLVSDWDRVAYGMLRDFRTGAYAKAFESVKKLISIDDQIAATILQNL